MRRRFSSLDGLRALSILPVVWHHATPGPLGGVLDRGPLGVDLFFTISGFLITTLLLDERASNGRIALRAFYARRSLRIFPLYYLVLGAYFLHAVLVRDDDPTRAHFLRNAHLHATYLTNWLVDFDVSHPVLFAFAWSLAVEEQFYLVWPWILRVRGLAVPAIFMAALLALDQAGERGHLGPILADGGLALRMVKSIATPICLGALLAIGLKNRPLSRALYTFLGNRFAAPIAFVLLVVCAVIPWSVFTAHLIMLALVGGCALSDDHHLRWLTDNRVARHIGAVSYGMYLVNAPIVTGTRRVLARVDLDGRVWLVFLLGTVVTVAVATLTHRIIERPFARLRDRFRPARPPSHEDRPEAAFFAQPSDRLTD